MQKIFFIILYTFCTCSFAAQTVMKIYPVYNRSASELQTIVKPLLEGNEKIIAHTSSLIIKASTARVEEIITLLNKLDTPLSNLTITVIQSQTRTAQEMNAAAHINISSKARQLAGRYSQKNTQRNNDSTQVIKTLEGTSAIIKIGKEKPIHNVYITESEYGYSSYSSTTQYIEVSTGFKVTTRLTGKQVTMEVLPWSDTMNNSGTIETLGAATTISATLGEWVEIASINEHNRNEEKHTLSHSYSTAKKNIHILIKVEKSAH